MTDYEKITALRDALKECRDRADPFDGKIISAIANAALAMTAEASEGATDEPTPWHERMAAHYEQGGKVICHPTKFFMQQEIDDWRARGGK